MKIEKLKNLSMDDAYDASVKLMQHMCAYELRLYKEAIQKILKRKIESEHEYSSNLLMLFQQIERDEIDLNEYFNTVKKNEEFFYTIINRCILKEWGDIARWCYSTKNLVGYREKKKRIEKVLKYFLKHLSSINKIRRRNRIRPSWIEGEIMDDYCFLYTLFLRLINLWRNYKTKLNEKKIENEIKKAKSKNDYIAKMLSFSKYGIKVSHFITELISNENQKIFPSTKAQEAIYKTNLYPLAGRTFIKKCTDGLIQRGFMEIPDCKKLWGKYFFPQFPYKKNK